MPLIRLFELRTWRRPEGSAIPAQFSTKPEFLATIDFEASSLHLQGEPIEVGIALWRRGDVIRTWSTLISPSPSMVWSAESFAIHGITREELSLAPHPAEVAEQLNALMEHSPVAYCDGGAWDQRWLGQLFDAAGISPAFRLLSYHRMHGLRPESTWNRMRHFLTTTKAPHRAGEDAVRLMHAYAFAMGESPDVLTFD